MLPRPASAENYFLKVEKQKYGMNKQGGFSNGSNNRFFRYCRTFSNLGLTTDVNFAFLYLSPANLSC